MSHSLGPWKVGIPIDDKENGGGFRTLYACDGGWIGDIRDGSDIDAGNISLIVAAPDLLAACEAVFDKCMRADCLDPLFVSAFEACKLAIIKAKGEP